MGNLVIDEWLLADLSGENSKEAQRQSIEFLEAVLNKCDRIVMVEDSRFFEKAWALLRYGDVTRRSISKYFTANFLTNSDKRTTLQLASLEDLPSDISRATKVGDYYLIQAYFAVQPSTIVTTDNPLRNALLEFGISCELRDEFIREYCARYGGSTAL